MLPSLLLVVAMALVPVEAREDEHANGGDQQQERAEVDRALGAGEASAPIAARPVEGPRQEQADNAQEAQANAEGNRERGEQPRRRWDRFWLWFTISGPADWALAVLAFFTLRYARSSFIQLQDQVEAGRISADAAKASVDAQVAQFNRLYAPALELRNPRLVSARHGGMAIDWEIVNAGLTPIEIESVIGVTKLMGVDTTGETAPRLATDSTWRLCQPLKGRALGVNQSLDYRMLLDRISPDAVDTFNRGLLQACMHIELTLFSRVSIGPVRYAFRTVRLLGIDARVSAFWYDHLNASFGWPNPDGLTESDVTWF